MNKAKGKRKKEERQKEKGRKAKGKRKKGKKGERQNLRGCPRMNANIKPKSKTTRANW
ncbi:MAG: hypothetical protein IPJ30_09300 [Acidobacteria bacterium]|nr:hypothetical protein [Acidobacteriota bacterium]